jgi:choline dehydrogenase
VTASLEADFVIVGSGSAGSALAYRLSEDGKHSVIVIEYGGSDIGPLIQMPSALSIPMNMSLYDWGFRPSPNRISAAAAGDAARQGAGRLVLDQRHGLCARPRPRFRPLGRAGRDRLGLCRRAALFQAHGEFHGGEDGWRGTDGPLHVQRGLRQNPLYARLRRGGPAGRLRDDRRLQRLQAGRLRAMEQTIHKGRRWSTANAYLRRR